MKSFLIKIGKSAKVIRRDGILGGGKRVAAFFINFLKMMRKFPGGDVLIITDGVGDSALYRASHVSEELNLNGFKSFVTVPDSPYLSDYASSFKVFVFHRVLFGPKIEKFISRIKSEKKEIIFETDDLVFDPKYLKFMDYFKQMNALERKLYENGVGGEILKDPYVKVCTTTTSFLAEKLKEYGKQVFIVPNKLSKSDVQAAENILKDGKKPSDGKVRLGYFSGTISHNKDFATITEALLLIMEKYPQVELFLVGPLDVGSKLNKFKGRIRQLPYVSRKKHFKNIFRVDINLSPLEIGNPFCESKSELKYFEAGILGIPTVASATQTFRKAINNGEDGFVASITDEWFSGLEKLIMSPHLRSTMGLKARQKALEQYYTHSAKNEEYYVFLRSNL